MTKRVSKADAERGYLLAITEGGTWLTPARSADYDRVSFKGKAVAKSWETLPMALITMSNGSPADDLDVPWTGDRCVCVTEATRDTLGRILEPHGELLPIDVGGERAWLFHPTKMVKLDVERSKLEMEDEFIVDIEHYELQDLPSGPAVLTLDNRQYDMVFTRALVDELRTLKLSGLEFEELR